MPVTVSVFACAWGCEHTVQAGRAHAGGTCRNTDKELWQLRPLVATQAETWGRMLCAAGTAHP